MARLNRRYRKRKKNPSGEGGHRSNPPLMSEIGEFVIPGFAGFAVTRFGTRIAATQVSQRWGNTTWGKHAGAVASVSAFLAAWFLAHRWKWLAKYQTPLVVGSAIAALQSIIQLYIPQLGWTIADATPDLLNDSTTAVDQIAQNTALPPGMVAVDDDPNLYVYNNAYDGGTYGAGASGKVPPTATRQEAEDDFDDLAIDSANESAQNMGIFG